MLALSRGISTLDLDIAKMLNQRDEYKKLLRKYEVYDEFTGKYVTLPNYYRGEIIYSVKVDEDNFIYVLHGRCEKESFVCDIDIDILIPE